MKPHDMLAQDLLDLNLPEAKDDRVWIALRAADARQSGEAVDLTVPFQPFLPELFKPDSTAAPRRETLRLRRYGSKIVRLSLGEVPDDASNPMLQLHPDLKTRPLTVNREEGADFTVRDGAVLVARIGLPTPPRQVWSSLIVPALDELTLAFYPDGKTEVPWMAFDTFTPVHRESIGLGYVTRNDAIDRFAFAHYAAPDEKFAGTGERFMPLNLSGRTLVLENRDALGVNSRRAYKNVPFYLSSRGYGLLVMTSAHVRLSLADLSSRAAQGVVADNYLDLFILGGDDLADVLYQYRLLTGFPGPTPLWSYGTWMSRMTYFSAEETLAIADRLREEDFPCDVIHLDTGWFRKDWQCEWAFNPETFPDPPAYFQAMRAKGMRVSLWQNPSIAPGTLRYDEAVNKRYLAPIPRQSGSGSDFGGIAYGGNIDFSNPEAVSWYQGLLKDLLEMGAAAIKTDFGEKINEHADYATLPWHRLHNLYSLLYQRAAYEVTEATTGEGIIWARAGWTGCQRYPVHWGGDCACSWDGLAGSIRGGLHIGLSGFAFWSCDVPGFHSLPEFMNQRPDDLLYLRWTQAAIFMSHLRYHGTSAREPYAYPAVAPLVRSWLKLRYALIPYLLDQSEKAVASGFPLMRALILHHADDPVCWTVDDAFYCGESLLVAPLLNAAGRRRVYLPADQWVDFWSGEILDGGRFLPEQTWPLHQIPVYARLGAEIRVYPHPVRGTDDMDLAQTETVRFDEAYPGFAATSLQRLTRLFPEQGDVT